MPKHYRPLVAAIALLLLSVGLLVLLLNLEGYLSATILLSALFALSTYASAFLFIIAAFACGKDT